MGVIYKLKEEVIEFILLQKKDSPWLSCRKLSELVQDRFAVYVSKSSINALLKTQQLSSPVGRHPKALPLKNFFIPREKKEALLSQVRPFLPAVNVRESEAQEPSSERLTSDSGLGNPGFDREPVDLRATMNALSVEEDEEEMSVGLPLIPDSAAENMRVDVLESEGEQRSPAGRECHEAVPLIWGAGDDGPLYENMGLSFLAAMWWEMSNTLALGRLLARTVGADVGTDDQTVARAMEAIIFLKGIDINEPADLSNEHIQGLSRLLTGRTIDTCRYLLEVAPTLTEGSRIVWEIESEIAGLMTEVSSLQIVLSDGQKFYLDPDFGGYQLKPGYSARNSLPLYRVLAKIADGLVTNVQPMIVPFDIRQDPGSMEFLRKWRLLTGQDVDCLDSVSVVTPEGRMYPVFERLARIDRKVVGLGACTASLYARVEVDSIGDPSKWIDPVTRQGFSWYEGKIFIGAQTVSAMVVENDAGRYLSFYNFNLSETERQGIFNLIGAGIKEADPSGELSYTPLSRSIRLKYSYSSPLHGIFWAIFDNIHSKVKERLFGDAPGFALADFQKDIYSVPGRTKIYNNKLLVRLYPQAQHPRLKELCAAAGTVNALSIPDSDGRNVVISIEK